MPDFTIEIHWQCSSLEEHTAKIHGYDQWDLFYENRYPQCSCPRFKFGKRTVNFGGMMYPPPCKHIDEAEKSVCGWHSAISPERMVEKGVCPRCGRNVVPVRFAV